MHRVRTVPGWARKDPNIERELCSVANIRLYTDNGCDLDKDILDGYGIRSFYMSTIVNDQTYQDRLNISPPEFYRLLQDPAAVPTTSQVNLADFYTEFSRVMQESEDEVLYIAFSSELSGTYQTACIARDQIAPERITVIDSRNASLGQGLTVLQAAHGLAAGMDKSQILAAIEDNIRRMEGIFFVGNLEMLKRGGRINPAAAAIGDLLSIKLILEIRSGKIEPLERAHGIKKAQKRLLDIMEQRGSRLSQQPIGLAYSQDLEGALEIREMVAERFGSRDFVISEVGALIGSHVGPGTYGLFFLGA
jgi:DegV family protein with EDD domain